MSDISRKATKYNATDHAVKGFQRGVKDTDGCDLECQQTKCGGRSATYIGAIPTVIRRDGHLDLAGCRVRYAWSGGGDIRPNRCCWLIERLHATTDETLSITVHEQNVATLGAPHQGERMA